MPRHAVFQRSHHDNWRDVALSEPPIQGLEGVPWLAWWHREWACRTAMFVEQTQITN